MRLFDMHCDTLYECEYGGHRLLDNNLQIDLTRGLRFEKWAQVFAVWMPDTIRGEAAREQCRLMLETAHNKAVDNRLFKIVYDQSDLEHALDKSLCAAIMADEGGSALAGRLDTLNLMAELGVKIITLTWNGSNELGHGCLPGCEDGLTEFGINAGKEMERLNIIPDVSHLNQAGFWDVMKYTNGRIIASHSVSENICSHPRNLTDQQLCAIRDRGGLVGLNLCKEHLGEQTFECLERHFEHYLTLGGEKTVAFGCDFDGTDIAQEGGGIQVME